MLSLVQWEHQQTHVSLTTWKNLQQRRWNTCPVPFFGLHIVSAKISKWIKNCVFPIFAPRIKLAKIWRDSCPPQSIVSFLVQTSDPKDFKQFMSNNWLFQFIHARNVENWDGFSKQNANFWRPNHMEDCEKKKYVLMQNGGRMGLINSCVCAFLCVYKQHQCQSTMEHRFANMQFDVFWGRC